MAKNANAHPVNGEYAYDGNDSGRVQASPRPRSKGPYKPQSKMAPQAKAQVISHSRKTKAISIGLWVVIAIGAIGGLRALIMPGGGGNKAVAGISDLDFSNRQSALTGFEGFAQMAVSQYLLTGEDTAKVEQLNALFCDPVDFTGVGANSFISAQPAVVQIEGSATNPDANYRNIWMAVQLTGAVKDKATGQTALDHELRYYKVSVLRVTDNNRAQYCIRSGPYVTSALTAPDPKKTQSLLSQQIGGEVTDDQKAVIQEFMSSYLTGKGHLKSFITNNTNSKIREIENPPFKKALVQDNYNGGDIGNQNVVITAHVLATDRAGRKQLLEYSLHLKFEAGDWKVDDLLSLPRLAPKQTSETE